MRSKAPIIVPPGLPRPGAVRIPSGPFFDQVGFEETGEILNYCQGGELLPIHSAYLQSLIRRESECILTRLASNPTLGMVSEAFYLLAMSENRKTGEIMASRPDLIAHPEAFFLLRRNQHLHVALAYNAALSPLVAACPGGGFDFENITAEGWAGVEKSFEAMPGLGDFSRIFGWCSAQLTCDNP